MAGRRWVPLIVLNAAVAAYVALYHAWPRPLVLSASITLVILCVPGVAWLRLVGRGAANRAAAAILTLALSACAGVVALVAQMLLGIAATPATHAAALAVITNAGLLVTWGRPWPAARRPVGTLSWRVLLPAAAAIYVLLFLGATRFVEPIEDQDIEIQGTAFGIARHGTPMMLHDRRLPYHFAHPHLFHWLSAEAILLAGDLEAVEPYYEAGVQAGRWLTDPLRPGEMHVVARRSWDPGAAAHRWESVPVRVEAVEGDEIVLDRSIRVQAADGTAAVTRFPTRAQFLDRILHRAYTKVMEETFEARPLLWQTRTANLGLALVALLLLHELAALLSGSRLVAALVPLAYISVPEVFERSCCATYTTMTVVFLVASAWWYMAPRRGTKSAWPWGVAFVAGALLALANHKAVVAVGGMILAGVLYHGLRRVLAHGQAGGTDMSRKPSPKAASPAPVRQPLRGVLAHGHTGGTAVREKYPPKAASPAPVRQPLRGVWRAGLRNAVTSPVAWGFAAGTAVFWTYGLAVSADVFIQDHLTYHIVNRVAHVDALQYVKPGVYPSVGALWWGFVRDAGVALPAVGAAALVWLAARGAGARPGWRFLFSQTTPSQGGVASTGTPTPARGAGARPGWRYRYEQKTLSQGSAASTGTPTPARGAGRSRPFLTLAFWGLAVAVAFSVVDWRQTKHLMLLMPVLVLAPAAAAGASARLGRLVWAGLLLVATAAALFLTVDWIGRGFDSFRPVGGW